MILIFAVFLQFLFSLISSLIIRKDKGFVSFKIVNVLLIGLVISFLYQYINIATAILTYIALLIYTCFIRKVSIERTIIFISLVMIITILSDHLATLFRVSILKISEMSLFEILYIHTPLYYLIGIILSVIVGFLISKMKFLNESKKIERILSVFMLFIWISYESIIILVRFLGDNIEFIILNLLFLLLYLIIFLSAMYLYIKSIKKGYITMQKETEYNLMMQYTADMEKQYNEIRKFRHDYQNIITSLDEYISSNDLIGLKDYFNRIKSNSEKTILNDFRLENLDKIRIKELKSIFGSKLTYAINLGIEVSFEAIDIIDAVSMDTVPLVRSLGILLDNAIEALEELGYGKLEAALIKHKGDVIIIIQNTCKKDIPKVHDLKRTYFTTKRNNQGLGLSNLSDIINDFQNVSLETIIIDETFIQKITITRGD